MTEHDFLKKIKRNDAEEELLQKLKKETLPLVMWGIGSLAYNVKRLLEHNGIKLSCCMVDGEVTTEDYNGTPVYTREVIMKRYEEVALVFGHSYYEKREEIQKECPVVKRCYCLVNICYGQWERMKYSFVKEHAGEYRDSMLLFEDELSRDCLLGYLNCKLTDDVGVLFPCAEEKASYFQNPFFEVTKQEEFLDIGAYTGDTLEEFLRVTGGNYKHIFAFEPEKEAYRALTEFVERKELKDISLYQYGCWKESTVLHFSENEESSRITEKESLVTIPVVALDEVLVEKRITLIKINFLDGVYETLEGAERIMRRQKPKLVMTVGFDEWALIRIPPLIRRLNQEYKLYLRYAAAMPARLLLFAC